MMRRKVYRRCPEIASENTASGAVLLSLKSGDYYELNSTGAYLWQLLRVRRTTEVLIEMFAKKCKISIPQSKKDVEIFLTRLSRAQIVQVESGRDRAA